MVSFWGTNISVLETPVSEHRCENCRLSDSRSHENEQRIMMVEVALFLAAVLQFSAVSERRKLITREGERVALPCDSVLPDQHGCGFTTWTVSSGPGQETKEVVQLGKTEPDEEHRLEMMKNCSLVIKKVTVKDVGHYECRQYRDSKYSQFPVVLSVVSITQEQSGNMEFICSVRTYRRCRFTVRWWFNGQKAVETPPSTCSAIFPNTSQTKGSYECEVTDGVNKKLFPFSPRASGEEPEETTTKPAPEKTEPGKPEPEKTEVKGLLLFVIVPLVLAALVVVVVMVIRWKRVKGNKTQINQRDELNLNPAEAAEAQPSPGRGQEMADPEDGVSYATICLNKTNTRKINFQVLGQDDDDDDGMVTYSHVKPVNDFSQ
ncbi:uncharacterized protein V6R79_002351 [Siganus canaliculatus]